MFDWSTLLDEAALTTVLPGTYSRFARPVRDGLLVFLSGLPEVYQEEILSQQAALPLAADISQRLALLARSCPVLHKLGQILARDPRLAPQLRQHLRSLESFAPTVPLIAIQQIVAQELGPLDRLGLRLAPPALAEASVAVVIPFESIRTGRTGPFVEGVFKLLKPGIESRLELELELLDRVGNRLDDRCGDLGLPHLDYEESFQQIRDKLMHEIRLDKEQQQLLAAASSYRHEPRVHIPAVLEYCTPRITAMERILGGKITDHPYSDPGEARRLAELVIRALIAHPFFSREQHGLFHCDPHAGNLFLTDDHRLAILDWSLVGTLTDGTRAIMMQLILAALALDVPRIVALLESLNRGRRLNRSALKQVAAAWLARIRSGHLPGLGWLVGLLDESLQKAGLRVEVDLLMFRKSLHTLEGVVADIHADGVEMDAILLAQWLRHFAAEWPTRWLTAPHSRAFATHLSNSDLFQSVLCSPQAAARWWISHLHETVAGRPAEDSSCAEETSYAIATGSTECK